MFDKILIANRGEIASRIATTCKRLGVKTVAVFSQADEHANFVALCDEAVALGGLQAHENYLSIDKIVAAAKQCNAQAIHPGYGFLSENADFAQACQAAGIVFIGPPASAIHAMGSKSQAKSLLQNQGIPLTPGYHGEQQEPEFLLAQAKQIGFPILIKATAGGGGKGMRVVQHEAEFAAALASCQREALASFMDGRVLLEKFLQRPRHIEVQIFADRHGQCVHLFERDCSAQRRYQKVVEEAPAPNLNEATRSRLGEVAIKVAQAVGYEGAGTVEFIMEPSGEFYFMEMNTRLQVEHPVTEMICGVDLVEWQLRVASGEPLPKTQQQIQRQGHAFEARIYCENPGHDFLPSIGKLHHLRWPKHVTFALGERALNQAPVVRVDSAVLSGDEISAFYDPMMAKLICWGPTRESARSGLVQALRQTEIIGPGTNRDFLRCLLQHPEVIAGPIDNGWIARELDDLIKPFAIADEWLLAAAAVELLNRLQATTAKDVWQQADGFRLVGQGEIKLKLWWQGRLLQASLQPARDNSTAMARLKLADGASQTLQWQAVNEQGFRTTLGDKTCLLSWQKVQQQLHVFIDGETAQLQWHNALDVGQAAHPDAGRFTAPMPGRVLHLLLEAGTAVQAGQALMVLEAMKMEHTITAPHSGILTEFMFAAGEQVSEGDVLYRIEPAA